MSAWGQLDSVRVEEIAASAVSAVRPQKDAPFAVANIGSDDLEDFSSYGRELPLLLSRTPGVLAWGENGLGTGTSYMRIRGAGDSRINVTLDGVPLNSPEDQCVFWANMNSYASLMGSVQIQRGVGASSNGDGAFGGTVSLSSKAPSLIPSVTVTSSWGSYNTYNAGARFTTGLTGKHLVIEGAYHRTGTEGYIHGTAGRSGSYSGGISWLGRDVVIKYLNIGNFECTGQAWNGVVAGNDDESLMNDGIRTYADMYERGLGRFNSLYERLVFDDVNWTFPKDDSGNYMTERYALSDGSLWPQTTDNFWQNHNLLNASWRISSRLDASATLHYTYGYGYYEEFRCQNKLGKFGLTDPVLSRADFVRRKGLEQNTYGVVGSLDYKNGGLNIVGGFSLQRFTGNHFGYLTYASDGLDASLLSDGWYKYYDSDAEKGDCSAYVKASYTFGRGWLAFADLQLRSVGYTTGGVNDKFIKQTDGTYRNQVLDIDRHYVFLNPKAGISYSEDGCRVYASIAVANREPERNNFTDNGSYPAPRPERVFDYEAGWQYDSERVRFSQNYYYMKYDGQFVQTGAVSDIGEALTTNIKDSYRAGVETSAAVGILSCLTLEANAALSENRILDFDESVENWDGDYITVHYDNSTLAYSPFAIVNGFLDFHLKGFSAVWHTAYVSRQYLDNTACEERSLPSYCVSDMSMSYTLKFPRIVREAVFGLNLGNVLNSHFAASGWVYSAVSESLGYTPGNRYRQIGFIPMAGTTVMGSLKLKF